MSNKKLTILAVVAVFMVFWAAVQSRVANRRTVQTDAPAYLIQGLDPADIGEITLGTGQDAVTLRRRGENFVVAEKDNYPAKTSEVNSLISKCLEIKTTELITEDPKNHEDLEVTEDKARTVVKFMTPDPNSTLLAGVVVGKTEELGQGTYVRLLSSDSKVSDRVLSSPDVPWIADGATNYIEQELISAESDEIESVTVGAPKGEFVIEKASDSGDPVLVDMPAGKKLKTSDAKSVLTALTSLRFDDVQKEPADITFQRHYICKLKDSTEYTLRITEQDEKTYIACTAKFADTAPIRKGSEVESDEELKAKEAKLLARDEAAAFTTKHEGWLYEIADHKAKNLTKDLADLLEAAEPEEKAESVEDADAADPNSIVPDVINEPLSVEPNEATVK